VTPDILNIAKQVTNGVQPLGAVVAKQEIYDTFMAAGGPDYMLEFPHGYTYSAHPVACAAGLATLDLLEKEDAVGRVRALAPHFERRCTASRARSTWPTSATTAWPQASPSRPCPASRPSAPT
jgi:adenosylmethionine-8-amino-7-oxononanoate aminotransferase